MIPLRYNVKKQNKLSNQKCTYNGEKFDSKKELNRYCELLILQKSGVIKDLQRQVKFQLLPSQREPSTYSKTGKEIPGKVIEQAVCYIADFVYIDEHGNKIVEDVKGYRDPASATYVKFIIKRKMMLYFYGIRIREI